MKLWKVKVRIRGKKVNGVDFGYFSNVDKLITNLFAVTHFIAVGNTFVDVCLDINIKQDVLVFWASEVVVADECDTFFWREIFKFKEMENANLQSNSGT